MLAGLGKLIATEPTFFDRQGDVNRFDFDREGAMIDPRQQAAALTIFPLANGRDLGLRGRVWPAWNIFWCSHWFRSSSPIPPYSYGLDPEFRQL